MQDKGTQVSGQARPADADPSIRWVKVEWAEYSLRNEQIMEWLEHYGAKAGELTEDIHPDSDSDDSPIGSGTYSVKMRLTRDIPQLLPMFGRRIRIYPEEYNNFAQNAMAATLDCIAGTTRCAGSITCSSLWRKTQTFLKSCTEDGGRP